MDPNEYQWRINSSFSPPASRRDCRPGTDGLSLGTRAAHIAGSSLSSLSKASRSVMSGNQSPNHHHSVSEGALSYFESPSDIYQAPRWTPPIQRYDLGEFSTPSGGAKPSSFVFAQCNERGSAAGVSSVSNSLGSPSPPSESSLWGSIGKHSNFFPPRNFSSRRSFMSKPVYPLVFRNPVSDDEVYGLADASACNRMTPGVNNRPSPVSTEDTSSPELEFHKSIAELQRMEASPEPGTGSRRDGFRWSNASTYNFGFEGETIITEQTDLENLRSHSSGRYHKCGLCERFLWQKSPCSSGRIIRSGDMPIAGVLPCSHMFHAECLEEITPKGQIHEPPCPICSKTISDEGSISFSKPLQVPRVSANITQRMNTTSDGEGSSSNPNVDQTEGNFRRNLSLPMVRRGGSLMKNNFKKRFSLKGKMGKDLFGTKIFGRSGASYSSSSIPEGRSQSGCLQARQSQSSGSKTW